MTLTPRGCTDLGKMRRVTRKNERHPSALIAEWRAVTRTPALVWRAVAARVATLDPFDNDPKNNFAIIGAPGSGKSVLDERAGMVPRAIGVKVWMLDLGRPLREAVPQRPRAITSSSGPWTSA